MKKTAILIVLILLINITSNGQCWKMVFAGGTRSAGVKQDGTLWHWGNGIGSTPTRFGTDNNWDQVFLATVDGNQTNYFAIKIDGSLWVNGISTAGQLGLGNITNTGGSFVRIGLDNNWQTIRAGRGHCIALKTNGALYSWGNNASGELGLGDNIQRNSPVQIGTSNDWFNVSVFSYGVTSVALKTDGTLWGWGANGAYQLGLGHNASPNVPTQIGTDNDWIAIGLGENLTYGIKSGKLYVFGFEHYFIPPNGTSAVIYQTPAQVGTQTDWTNISVGDVSYIATAVNNFIITHKARGVNNNGQLGTGDYQHQNTPVLISGNNSFPYISSYFNSLALTVNGDLWVWGDNFYGQLGVTGIQNSNVPIPIPCPLTTLPITLTSLSAQKTNTGPQLTWQTATETNNKGFDIEKSTDGISFTKIGFVSGSNNSSTIKNYNYTDNSLCTSKQFYRLKQIDNNGNFKYSDIATVLCQNNAKVVITPNPVSSTVTIIADNLVQLKLISSSGQIISTLKASVSNTNYIDVSKLPAGMYLVNMFFKDGSYTTQNLQVRH